MATPMQAEYSPRPLADRIGLKAGMAVAFVALPAELAFLKDSAVFSSVASLADSAPLQDVVGGLDALIAFFTRRSDYLQSLERMQNAIRRDGFLWACWPKKSSGMASDLGDVVIRDAALRLDLVDVKVAAIDATWSGPKLVIRRDRR